MNLITLESKMSVKSSLSYLKVVLSSLNICDFFEENDSSRIFLSSSLLMSTIMFDQLISLDVYIYFLTSMKIPDKTSSLLVEYF